MRHAHGTDLLVRDGRDAGVLAGVPLGVKDCIDVAGLRTTGGVSGRIAPAREDAEVIARLRAAGTVVLGKTSMDQLGWTTDGVAPGFRPCLNPLDHSCSAGGSSSGSAAAVAAATVPIALGTDVGGSVRVPASYCGVVGVKPPRGMLPLEGCMPIVPEFDLLGVLAGTVRDVRLVLEVAGGPIADPGRDDVRVGCLDELIDAAEPVVRDSCRAALGLAPDRFVLSSVRLTRPPHGFGTLLAAELARTWGSRVARAPVDFASSVRASVTLGRGVSDARRASLFGDLRRWRERVEREVSGIDVLACPTLPHRVPPLGAASVEAATRFTRIFNALEWAAVSIPCGRDERGMPVGLQLASRPGAFGQLLLAAASMEAALADVWALQPAGR
jgi:aspartyl-tRNA(Asn)/glutamyl-tRNA(Gln) amidotransferase subunit A